VIGIDSSVLLRYLLDDDPLWSPVATRFIEEELTAENPGYINLLVLAETVWTLRRSPLFDNSKLALAIEGLLEFDKFVVADRDTVADALMRFRADGAGFANFLIAELNRAAGASVTVAIDRAAARSLVFRPLPEG
jgi:predicted nucleic-acid-binding protein